MHQIGVVGLSYRHASVDDVARFAIPKDELAARLPALRNLLGAAELVYVSTCNRVEIVFAMADGESAGDSRREVFRALTGQQAGPGEAERMLRAWTGEAAVEHLFLVACGLDSAQAGEQEIATQLRYAWDASREAHISGPMLDRLMGEALAMANRVHRLEAGLRAPSLADLASDRVMLHMGQVPGVVALVGVSPMNRRCAKALHEKGVPLVVVNRTVQTAEDFADDVNAKVMSLQEFRAQPPEVAAVILAAGASEPLLDAATLALLAQAPARAPLLIDFGLPPNIDPEQARAAGLTRIGMNDLIQAARDRRLAELVRLAPVRASIDERLTRLRGELASRAIGRRLADLRDEFERIATDEVDKLLADDLSQLDDVQRALLQRFATSMARRLAHLPLAGMRAAAAHASTEALDAFFREARLSRHPQD